MTMSSIVQDKIIENKWETGDSITGEIFSMSAVLPEDANQEVGKTMVKTHYMLIRKPKTQTHSITTRLWKRTIWKSYYWLW